MKALITIAAVALTAFAPAHAALIAVEQAYELNVAQIERWPLSDTGRLVIRTCRTCESIALRVDAATRYRLGMGGAAVSRDELVRLQATLNDRDGTHVFVFYRPDDGVATRIVLDIEER